MMATKCLKCGNGGKRYDDEACVLKGWPWGRVPFAYCDCPIGQAVQHIESTTVNHEDMVAAVQTAVDAGAKLLGVQIPRYPRYPEINAQLDALEAAHR
jgi:hypothetical protein